MSPALILVGADKGGVGKTTISRALLDYFARQNIPTRAFDSEAPRGALKRFHPEETEIVDLTQASDQMRVIDTLATVGPKVTVVDVRAGQLGMMLAALRDTGFLDAVRDREFGLGLFHILGPSISSLDEIAATQPFMTDAHYFLVKNHINDTTFFEWDPATYKSYFSKVKSAVDVTIPKLNELAYEQVELSGVPFTDFIENKTINGKPVNNSFVLRGYVRTWMRNVVAEFERIKLAELVAAKAKRAAA
jgi:hypothetical protein